MEESGPVTMAVSCWRNIPSASATGRPETMAWMLEPVVEWTRMLPASCAAEGRKKKKDGLHK